MDDLLREFFEETSENINDLDATLVKLEQNPKDKTHISEVFRVMHTLKGSCRFVGLPRLEMLAHETESLLSDFWEGRLDPRPEFITLLFQIFDYIREILEEISKTGLEPDIENTELIKQIRNLRSGIAEINIKNGHKAEDIDYKNLAHQTLRVNVNTVEGLVSLSAQIALCKEDLLKAIDLSREDEIKSSATKLDKLITRLQEDVLKARMQAIGKSWQQLPRITRDISHELGKKIELKLYGKDTQLDRQIIEQIKDPLTHMIRNAADHGIETPEQRLNSGKNETGIIELSAHQQGELVVIELIDDGAGLSTEKIRKKILDKNLVSEEELALMNERQIQQYIFEPGFSTADAVTSYSGRGVGMDVVKSNLERIGGSIFVKSREGKETKFTIHIPLTLDQTELTSH
jgi:two-component system chemotaxis sensor kinase CheA